MESLEGGFHCGRAGANLRTFCTCARTRELCLGGPEHPHSPQSPLPTSTAHACNRAFQLFPRSFCPGRVRVFLGRMDFRMCSWFMVGGIPVRRRGSTFRSCKQNYPDMELGKRTRPAILHAEDYACCIVQIGTGGFFCMSRYTTNEQSMCSSTVWCS